MLSNVLRQLQHSRPLSFSEQVDQQVEMSAFVGLTSQSVLAGQDE
jgi:hypothetical protein